MVMIMVMMMMKYKDMLFVPNRYYQYYGNRLIQGPRPIEHYGLPANLSNMDAVLIWGGNGRTYFFKGNKYWRYDDRVNKVDLDYPRDISSTWKNVPDNLDTATQWHDGLTYFFKGTDYYKIDDFSIQVAAEYPKRTGREWIKCSELKKSVEQPKSNGSRTFDRTSLFRTFLSASLLSVFIFLVLW